MSLGKINVFSIFSGVGGLDSVFLNDTDNFNCIGFSEIDKNASAVLKYNHPDVPNWGSVERLEDKFLPHFDLLIGGFPCTGISTQGKQEGLENEGSGLFRVIPKILKRQQPRYALLENVKNLLSKQMENDFEHIKKEIEEAGYNFSYRLQDSSHYGTPQQRVRVIMLCVRKDLKPFGKSDSLYEVKQRCTVKENPLKQYVSYSKSTRKEHTDYRIREDNLINTLTTGNGCKGASTGTMVIQGDQVRNLKPIEGEALMTWPKNWTKYGMVDGKKVKMKDAARYKMIGNGVASKCIAPFRKHILRLELINN